MPLKTLWLCHRHHVMVTFKRLSLLPAAVYQFWEQEKVSRIASDLVGMERIVRRIKKYCGDIKTMAASA